MTDPKRPFWRENLPMLLIVVVVWVVTLLSIALFVRRGYIILVRTGLPLEGIPAVAYLSFMFGGSTFLSRMAWKAYCSRGGQAGAGSGTNEKK